MGLRCGLVAPFCPHCCASLLWGEVRAGFCSTILPTGLMWEGTQTCPLLRADLSGWVFSHVPLITPCFSQLHEGPSLLQHFPKNIARKWLQMR